ncbi:DEK C-terminal [Trinorchestia longiramus]|nr:DEK C-terminal [Trinorchestia longiramus]
MRRCLTPQSALAVSVMHPPMDITADSPTCSSDIHWQTESPACGRVTHQSWWFTRCGSALQVLHRHCAQARSQCHYEGGLSHDWLNYYERNLTTDQSRLNEWNIMASLLSKRPPSPETITCKEETQLLIRSKLKEIMMSVDIDEVTSKVIRQKLEKDLAMDLFKYKSYIDQEMLTILGQMDAATEIFPHVFLGSEWNASNLEELNKNGIGYILNVTMEIDNFFPGMFKYKNIRVYDNEKTDLLCRWDETYRYINAIKERGSKVLVHCKMGISRSASVVIAYAMKALNLTLGGATELVKNKRSCVKPNNAFAVQLKTYEGILDASRQRHNALWRSKSETNLQQPPKSPQDGASPTSPNRPTHKERLQKRATGRRSQPIRPWQSKNNTHSCSLFSSSGENSLRAPDAFEFPHSNLLLPDGTACVSDCLARTPSKDDVFLPGYISGNQTFKIESPDKDEKNQEAYALDLEASRPIENVNNSASSPLGSSSSAFDKNNSHQIPTFNKVSATSCNAGSAQLFRRTNLDDVGNRIINEGTTDLSSGLHHSQSSSSHLYCYASSPAESPSCSATKCARYFAPTNHVTVGLGDKSEMAKLTPQMNNTLTGSTEGFEPATAGGLLISVPSGRRPKSWSPDDRIVSLLFPSSPCGDDGMCGGSGDDLSVGGQGRRRSGSLDLRTPFELERSKLVAGGVDSRASPSLLRSASTGGSVEGLSPLYLAHRGSVKGILPQYLQLSSSVKDRITEFETASGRAHDCDASTTVAGATLVRDSMVSAADPDSKTGVTLHTMRRTPLLTFDNTVTSSDDFETNDVIEIPLSATEEVIPYDPLTVKIRTEQQQMMKRHVQQKQLAYKNTRLPIKPSKFVQQMETDDASFLAMRSEEAPCIAVRIESVASQEEGNPCVVVPNESITWKSGIVKRQKQDFEELTRSSDSVRGYYGSVDYREPAGEGPNNMVASTSLNVLNSISVGGTEDESCTDELAESCPIVRSKSLKESRLRPRVSDPFSNDVDRVFAKEEKKSERCSVIAIEEAKCNSPSRNNSWGSFDSALGLENKERDLPSRQSSWGSCDTRVTGLYPSRNNSIGKFDTTRRPHNENRTGDGVAAKQYSSHSPTTVVSCTGESEKSSCSSTQAGLSRIGSFSGSSSCKIDSGIVSSYSFDQLNSAASCCGSKAIGEPVISLSKKKSKIFGGSESGEFTESRTGRGSASFPNKVYLPPPFKLISGDKEPTSKSCSEDAHLEMIIPVPSPSSVPPERSDGVFRNRIEFQLIPTDFSRSRSQLDIGSSSSEYKFDTSSVAEASYPERSVDGAAATTFDLNTVMRSPTSPYSDSSFSSRATYFRPVDESKCFSSNQTSPIDDVLVPGTVQQQRRRLESWLHDSSENKELDRRQPLVDEIYDFHASNYTRSFSSCSVDAPASPVSPSTKCGKICRSFSEKHAKLEGRRYGGRVKKLTRDLEEISSSREGFSQRRIPRTTFRQRSHSLERLSTSPTSPHKENFPSPSQKFSPSSPPEVPLSCASSVLDQLVLETQAQVRDLQRDVSESSQESTDEISVKSLVDIYEKPLADKKNSAGRIKSFKDIDTSNNINNNFCMNNNSGSDKTRPRSDSAGEKYLPPVPQRKSSLDINVRSSSQPPRSPLKMRGADFQSGLANKQRNSYMNFRKTGSSTVAAASDTVFPFVRTPSSHFLQGSSNKHGSNPPSPKLPPGCPKPLQSFGSSPFKRSENKNLETAASGIIANANIPDNRIRGAGVHGRRGYSLSMSKSSPVLSKSSLMEAANTSLTKSCLGDSSLTNNGEVSSSSGPNGRAQACSTEMRRRKQQGKTHPLSRLPTRETGLP